METKIILEQLTLIEQEMNIKFPELYKKYLSEEVKDSEDYEIINNRNENIYIYNCEYIKERNKTYEIQDVEPYYFLIGQDGDLGYYIYVKAGEEREIIYSLDLGALGSAEMDEEVSNIYNLGQHTN